jgi:hypothetical protein
MGSSQRDVSDAMLKPLIRSCGCYVAYHLRQFPKLKTFAYRFRDLGLIDVPPFPIISVSVNPQAVEPHYDATLGTN